MALPATLTQLTDHCCRSCFGRVFSETDQDGRRRYVCSNCGVAMEGPTPAVICACGTKLRNGRHAGLRCVRNPEPTPEFPSLIVVESTN